MECEILRSPVISYRSLLFSTTVQYDSDEFIQLGVICIDMVDCTLLMYTSSIFIIPLQYIDTTYRIRTNFRGMYLSQKFEIQQFYFR